MTYKQLLQNSIILGYMLIYIIKWEYINFLIKFLKKNEKWFLIEHTYWTVRSFSFLILICNLFLNCLSKKMIMYTITYQMLKTWNNRTKKERRKR